MPRYEYFCEKCKEEFHLYRPMAESGEKGKCEKCGEMHGRIFGMPNIIWFFGSCHYDRINNFTPGTSSLHLQNDMADEDRKRWGKSS
jgi:putative FmdB family regulatory protein